MTRRNAIRYAPPPAAREYAPVNANGGQIHSTTAVAAVCARDGSGGTNVYTSMYTDDATGGDSGDGGGGGGGSSGGVGSLGSANVFATYENVKFAMTSV